MDQNSTNGTFINGRIIKAVYDCAQEWAQKNDAILELRGSGRESDYSKLDYMNMSIASNSDGIILQYSGEQGLEAKINEGGEEDYRLNGKRVVLYGCGDYSS